MVSGHWNILLAEDDPLNQKIMHKLFASRGHLVQVASNGLEAMDLLANDRFDVVLMDLTMPYMDGLETALAIRSKSDLDPHLPIIALSAHDQHDQLQQPGMAAFDAYIMKPVNFERLFATIAALVGNNTDITPLSRTDW